MCGVVQPARTRAVDEMRGAQQFGGRTQLGAEEVAKRTLRSAWAHSAGGMVIGEGVQAESLRRR